MQFQVQIKLMSFFSLLQATLAILDKLDIETENPTEEEVARKFGWEDDYLADDLSLWQRVKPKIFSLFDEPHSSTCARVRNISQYLLCHSETCTDLHRYFDDPNKRSGPNKHPEGKIFRNQ